MQLEKTYEMMWDCQFCGNRKLLGKTHRHCPNCGAPQDPQARYFPPDNEKVAVEDHVYVGTDLICPACQNASSRQAKHCGNCGSPLDGAQSAKLHMEQVQPEGVPYAGGTSAQARAEFQGNAASPVVSSSATKTSKTLLGCLIAGGVFFGLAVLSIVVVLSLFKKKADFEVAGHSWRREIAIEKFGQVKDSDWCDHMPSGASSVTRRKEIRSTKKVADGEDCVVKKVDKGDGTYKEKRECKPKYKDEPVYDDKCDFMIGKWQSSRSAVASGNSLNDTLRWPDVNLSRTGNCDGCERQGNKTESYTVRFAKKGSSGESSCDFDQTKWSTFKVGGQFTGKTSIVTGSLDCDSLQPSK
jgi:hypothetical protein